jgi:long-subunit acyl-CoA synthetase (AMP-forming)
MLYKNPLLENLIIQSKKTPHKQIIIQSSGKSISAGILILSSHNVAYGLSEKGFKKGDRVLLLVRPSIELTIFVLAILILGGVIVVVDPGMGQEVFINRIKLANPLWIFTEPIIFALKDHPIAKYILRKRGYDLPEVTTIENVTLIRVGIPLPGTFKALSFNQLVNQTYNFDISHLSMLNSDDEAMIVFTSGTTTMPKGVVHTICSLTDTIYKIERILKSSSSAVYYAALSQFLLLAVVLGVTVIIPNRKLSGKNFLDDILKYKPTVIFGPPAEFMTLINFCKSKRIKIPSYVNKIFLGSSPVLVGFLNKLTTYISDKSEVICVYGMTEIIPVAMVSGKYKRKWRGTGDLLGEIVSGIEYKIAKDGELLLKGKNLFKNYLGFKKATWAETGDIVKIVNNQLVLLGRKKDMIIRGNFNIYPSLYETIIQSIPGIIDCALVGVQDDNKEDEKVFLVIQPDDIKNKNIVSFVKKSIISGEYSIDSQAYPDKIITMELPRSGRQRKVDKKKLRQIISQKYL